MGEEAARLVQTAETARIGKQELAVSLQIDRSTLWKYERWPETAPEGFWARYREALASINAERKQALVAAGVEAA